jgi:putative membrane protein
LSEPLPPAARRLHPATLAARWLKSAPQMLFGAAGLSVAARDEGISAVVLVALLVLAAAALFAGLYWWRFRYTIGEGEIVIEQGLLRRRRRVIPFDRVQDIAIEQKLLARLFGTAAVRIETGGAARDEGTLDMIALADAEALRDQLRHGARAAAEPDEAPAEEPLLFAMGVPRLILSGLFGFSLVFFAVITGALQQLDQFGLVNWSLWFTVERADRAAELFTARLLFGLAGLVLALGLVAGVVRAITRDYGYRLTRTRTGLRRRRGLLTLTEVVIPIRRAQVALIESGPVARALGWYRLSFQTLGADRKEGGVEVAAPFARMDEILPILAEAGFPPPPPRQALRGVPRRALLRQAAPALALAAVAAALAFLVEPWLGVAALALLAAAVTGALRWRKHAHALGETALFVSGGLFKRRTWIVPYEKTQTIRLVRGPVQRALRLSHLLLDTAGSGALVSPEMQDLDESEAEAMAEELLARFQAARARASEEQLTVIESSRRRHRSCP